MSLSRNGKRAGAELARARLEAELQKQLADAATAQLAETRRQYENRLADLKEAHELRVKELLRTVKALADDVEFLRSKTFGPSHGMDPRTLSIPVGPEELDFMPAHNPHWISEEEEDVLALRAGGHIDPITEREALATLRAAVGGVPIQIEQS